MAAGSKGNCVPGQSWASNDPLTSTVPIPLSDMDVASLQVKLPVAPLSSFLVTFHSQSAAGTETVPLP